MRFQDVVIVILQEEMERKERVTKMERQRWRKSEKEQERAGESKIERQRDGIPDILCT